MRVILRVRTGNAKGRCPHFAIANDMGHAGYASFIISGPFYLDDDVHGARVHPELRLLGEVHVLCHLEQLVDRVLKHLRGCGMDCRKAPLMSG